MSIKAGIRQNEFKAQLFLGRGTSGDLTSVNLSFGVFKMGILIHVPHRDAERIK